MREGEGRMERGGGGATVYELFADVAGVGDFDE